MPTDVSYERFDDLNSEGIFIVDRESGDELQLQRALFFDEQDRSLGQATYCLVRAGATHYGGVESWALDAGQLVLVLTEDAARVLELPQRLEIPIEDGSALMLDTWLPRLLK